jgi:TolB-like protein
VRTTIAVLPFADYSPEHDKAYFCRGLREEILYRIARLGTHCVLAWEPGESASPAPAATERWPLHATMVVGGSLRTSGDRLRLTTYLIDGASGRYVWSVSMDSRPAEGFHAQEQLARAVVGRLRARLRPA